jgi:DNA polymerase elongation subunit (family B)
MNFYTSVRQYGNNLLVRGVNEEGRYQHKVPFSPTLFRPATENTGYTSLFGDDVAPVSFSSIKEAKEYVARYEGVDNFKVYGNTSFAYQYITESYGGSQVPYDSSRIKVAILDIETASEGGFPQPDTALEEVLLITIGFRGSSTKHVFGLQPFDAWKDMNGTAAKPEDVRYVHCSSERKLLLEFLRFWRDESPDVVSGWNCVPLSEHVWLKDRITMMGAVEVGQSLSVGGTIKNVFPVEKKNTYVLTTSLGTRVRATAEHRFPVVVKQKKEYKNNTTFHNLKQYQTVEEITQTDWDSHDLYLHVEKRVNSNVDNPKFSDDILRMAGLLYTDGSVDGNSWRFYSSNGNLLNWMDAATAPLSPRRKKHWSESTPDTRGKNRCYKITFLRQACRSLEDLILENGKKKLSIEVLSTLSFRQFMLFLSGVIDGDGHVGESVCIANSREIDALGLMELLQWNGIFSSKNSSGLRLMGGDWKEHLSLMVDYKKEAINKCINSPTRNSISANRRLVPTEEGAWVRIDSVLPGEKELVRDIETETHEFALNGVRTHNCKFFDMPYLINRIARVLDNDAASSLSPWNIIMEKEQTFMNRPKPWYDIYGVDTLDYLELYKKFTFVTRESYSLDRIAEVELGRKKLKSKYSSFKETYTKDWAFFTSYNIVDVEIVEALEDKLQLIELAFAMAYDAGCNFADVFSPVRVWDTLIYNYLHKKNVVLPQAEDVIPRRIEGGYVEEPKPSAYKWVVSFDATSLYPSIIMQWNMSPETLTDTVIPVTPEHLLAQGIPTLTVPYALTANGHTYHNEVKGVFPELIEKGFAERVAFNTKLKEYKKQLEALRARGVETGEEVVRLKRDISRYHVLQLNKKILLNSLYGAMANAYFRLGDYRIAEGITMTGQFVIQYVGRHVNNYLNKALRTTDVRYVFYKDTDSIYIQLDPLVQTFIKGKPLTTDQIVEVVDRFCKDKLSFVIDEACETLFRDMQGIEKKIMFKREAIADRGVWLGKKRYALNVYDNEGVRYTTPELKVTGIESVRSSTPAVVRQYIEQALRLALQTDERTLQQYIQQVETEFMALTPEQIAFPRSLSGVEKYADVTQLYAKGTPIATRAAILHNFMVEKNSLSDKYQLLQDGDKIRFIYLRVPNPMGENIIGFVNEMPVEFGLHTYVDYPLMFTKTFLDPLRNILQALRWSHKEVVTLDDLF